MEGLPEKVIAKTELTGKQHSASESVAAVELTQESRKGTFEEILMLLDRHKVHGRVLDFPSGPGKLSVVLRERGCDVYSADLDIPSENPYKLNFIESDLDKALPFEDNFFDFVVCGDGIEHVESPFLTIREFARILRPGGVVLISTPNYLNIEKRFKFLLTGQHTGPIRRIQRLPHHTEKVDAGHINPLTYPRLEHSCYMAGLDIVDVHVTLSKAKQIFLWPFAAIVQAVGKCRDGKRREQYKLDVSNSNKVLLGGHKLMIMARKSTDESKQDPSKS